MNTNTYWFNPIPIPYAIHRWLANNPDIGLETLTSIVLSGITIISDDYCLYDDITTTYDHLSEARAAEVYDFALKYSEYLSEYIRPRPEYHLIYFLEVEIVVFLPFAFSVSGRYSTKAEELFVTNSNDTWGYIQVESNTSRQVMYKHRSEYF